MITINEIKSIIIFLLILGIYMVCRNHNLNALNRFGIGKVDDIYGTPRRLKCSYTFTSDSIVFYKGLYQSTTKASTLKKGMDVLIAYDLKNPTKTNFPLFKFTIDDISEIDSLNECCDPKEYISSWEY